MLASAITKASDALTVVMGAAELHWISSVLVTELPLGSPGVLSASCSVPAIDASNESTEFNGRLDSLSAMFTAYMSRAKHWACIDRRWCCTNIMEGLVSL